MTVISRSLNYFAPVISSDLLLSTREQLPPFVPPTLESSQTHFLEGLVDRPIGLAQKIYVLTDTICIALAGRVIEMRDILEDLGRYCRITPGLDAEGLRTFLRGYDFSSYTECAFFLMVIDRSTEGIIDVKEIKMGEFVNVDSEMFDQSEAIGSGADEFLEIITQKMKFRTSFADGDIRQSLVKHGSLIAHLLVRERATKKNLQSAWGGGFEFAVYDGRRFVKPDNVAYILNFAYVNENNRFEMPVPVMVLHHRYEDEILVITKVFWKNHILGHDEIDRYILTSDDVVAETFIVPPIKRGVSVPEDLKVPRSFETGSIGMGHLLNTHDGISALPAYFTVSTDIQVVYSAESGRVQIFMREAVTELIREMINGTVLPLRESP
jgi:hypothetical protein